MDPVVLFELATGDAATMVGRVRPEQWHAPTPCAEWDVEALVAHMVGGFLYLESALGGDPSPVALDEPSYRDAVQRCVTKLWEPGALEHQCLSPAGFEWSIADAAAGTAMDQVVHTWDLAVAIGADRQLDGEIVEACVAMFLPQMPAIGREAGFIGPEVSVSADASAQEVLLGAMGRTA